MIGFQEYAGHDAIGLGKLVADKSVSSEELLDAALARLAEVNPRLNAVISTSESLARRTARSELAAGPLSGVPFLIKDAPAEGMITYQTSRAFAGAPPLEWDSALVSAYRQAGLVIFGKTNTPEFGLSAITEPELTGPTLNPWDTSLTCGGSSGGAAVAVAAGILPAAQASDGGGSIRIPSSCCGLFGFKPSRGRVSWAPAGDGYGGMPVRHAITRSVRDSAALLDISCQPQPGDPFNLQPPVSSFLSEVSKDPPSLRIGVLRTSLLGRELAPECLTAVDDAARLCEALGHAVEETSPPFDLSTVIPLITKIVGTDVVIRLHSEGLRRGRPVAMDEIEPQTRKFYEEGCACSAEQYAKAVQLCHAATRTTANFYKGFDVLLLSTLGSLPIPLGFTAASAGNIEQVLEKFMNYAPNTVLFNITGQPAMSCPLAWSASGIPIGVQFAGKYADEATLFRLAGQLERARSFWPRRPPEVSW